MAVELEDFIPRVAMTRPPRETILQALRDTMRDFCQFSRIWKHTVTGATITAGQPTITISLPAAPVDSQVIAVDMVSVDGARPATARTVEHFDRMQPEWRTQLGDSYDEYTQESPSTFRFPAVPVNGSATGLIYRVDLKPTEDADQVEDFLRDEWLMEIAAGARAQLLLMPGKEWSDPMAAKAQAAVFANARGRARIRANQQYGVPDQMVRPKFLFAGK